MLPATLLAAVVAVGASPVAAGPLGGLRDFTVTSWNETDGLVAGVINAITQDDEGYLWIGTDIGLVRFDGKRFQTIDSVVPRLRFESVTALLSAGDGLWIGDGGTNTLVFLRGGTPTKYGAEQGVRGPVNSLLEDSHGTLWAATAGGLRRFDGDRWVPEGKDAGLDTSPTLAMHEDRTGAFWVATREKVLRRERAGEPFVNADSIEVSSNFWQAFAEDESGRVWITDFRAGLRRVGEPPDASPRHSGRGVRLLHDSRGNVWVATRGQGLWRLSPTSARQQDPDVMTAKDGLANDAVQSIFEDREGNIWVGTNAGLQRLTPHLVTPYTDVPIPRAMGTTSDGTVWVGTTLGLIAISPTAPARRQVYREANGFPGIVVLGLAVHPRGDVWVASERALARFENGRFITVTRVENTKRLFSIAFSDGSVWLRDVNFEMRRISERGEPLALDVPKAFHAGVRTLVTDREGRLWIAMRNGAVGVRSPGGAFRQINPNVGGVLAIFQDSSGAMWFGGESGFSRWSDEKFTTVTGTNGLRSSVSSIVEDANGDFWMGLRVGIALIKKAEIGRVSQSADYQLHFRLFNSAEGAAGIPVTAGSCTVVRGQDGRLWFATSGGLTVVDPREIELGPVPPPMKVRIESVRLNGGDPLSTSNLRLPSNPSHVQFDFTGLGLTDTGRVQFQYKLEGQDQDWGDPTTLRQASYTNLLPGQYQFLVRASHGGAFDEPEGLSFSVAPAFYQTGWFYALCFLAAALVLYGSWRLNARRVRGQFALVLAERIRMSRAIHDTLLQGLAGLALQLDDLSHGFDTPSSTLKERVQSMRKRVEHYMRDARQSIWDLRAPSLESKSLPEALRDVALNTINGMPVAFDFATHGTPRPCSPAVQEQLLRICQEAVTNAVRHGRPGRVGVELEYTDDAVCVRVNDDGQGFDPSSADGSDGHYGVVTMKERAAQVRGRLTIVSGPGQGTRVETVVPPM